MNEAAQNQGRVNQETIDAIREVVMIVRHLVNNPDQVKVDIECQGYSILAVLKTNPRDVGQVIGRNAHLINSVRSFLSAIAGKNNVRAVLDYVTDEDNRRETKRSQGNMRRQPRYNS